MRRPVSPEPTSGWVTATLRWIWGADDDVGLRELFRSAPVTWTFLGIVCVVSSIDFALGGTLSIPGSLTRDLGISPGGVAGGDWWRLLTTALVNPPELDPPSTGLQHLLTNVIGLVVAGPRVERTFGSRRFVLLLFGVTVSAAVALFTGTPFYWGASGGTSGAVFGLFGATLVIAINRRRRSKSDAIFVGALVVVFANLMAIAPALPAGTNISHFGGFVGGSLVAAVWCMRPASRRAGAAAAVALVVIAGSVAAARTVDVRRSDLAVRADTPLDFAPVMITPGFGSLWVTGGQATGEVERDQIVRIDPKSGRVSARIREHGVGGLPVVTKDRVWVAGKGTVVAIDPASNRVVSRIRLSDGAWPWGLAATKDALWAAVNGSNEVIRIDLRTREQKHISVGDRTYVVSAHGSNVWAASYASQTVSRLDPETGVVVVQRRLDTPAYHAVFLDGSLWVGAQPFIYRLHPESLKVIAKIDVQGDIWTLSPDSGGKLLVPQRYLRTIVQVDPTTNEVERRTEVGLRQPTSVVAIGDDIWIADPFRMSIVRTSAP
jgi:membrane associated rhomboid family serine protease/glutamine cyclotransferase